MAGLLIQNGEDYQILRFNSLDIGLERCEGVYYY